MRASRVLRIPTSEVVKCAAFLCILVQLILLYSQTREFIFDYKSSCFENEKHQTRVSLLLELVLSHCESNRGPVAIHAGYYTTRAQDRTMDGLKAAISISRIAQGDLMTENNPISG